MCRGGIWEWKAFFVDAASGNTVIRQPLIVRLSKMRREKRRNRGMTVAEGNVGDLGKPVAKRFFNLYLHCSAIQSAATGGHQQRGTNHEYAKL